MGDPFLCSTELMALIKTKVRRPHAAKSFGENDQTLNLVSGMGNFSKCPQGGLPENTSHGNRAPMHDIFRWHDGGNRYLQNLLRASSN
jgi:hypothetical protein